MKELFTRIQAAAEDMDIDALDGLLVELEQYQFEEEQAELFKWIAVLPKSVFNVRIYTMREQRFFTIFYKRRK